MATSSDGLSLNSNTTTISNNGSPTLVSTVHVTNMTSSVDDTTEGICSNVSDKTTTLTSTSTLHPIISEQVTENAKPSNLMEAAATTVSNKQLMLCRGFKDTACNILRNCNSLPLFVYTTTPSTRITSADGIGVGLATILKNDPTKVNLDAPSNGVECMDCLSHKERAASTVMVATTSGTNSVTNGTTPLAVGYTQQLKNAHLMNSHHTPYSNHYALHSEQTKSLQELQHEVGALLEFRDLVIETFPDLKHKMASMSSSASPSVSNSATVGALTSATNTLTNGSSLASRREWEPGIRVKRKISQKDVSTSASNTSTTTTATTNAVELNSSSLTRSRSNSHSGKKEPKSGGNGGGSGGSGENNGSVVQDSGFSTETSSSKDGHSASSTNGVITTGPHASSHRLSCLDTNDELLNLLDVIHRKSHRLREEMEHLQHYERQNAQTTVDGGAMGILKSHSGSNALTPKTFREHVERLNKEDIKQLRKERDRLLDKLAEMEAETLTGRIKATQMNNQLEELVSVKKDLEEQLKMAMAQKLELSSRVQQLQQQPQQKSSSSDSSSQRNFLSSATTVLSNGSHLDSARRTHTFQPVVLEQQQSHQEQLVTEFTQSDELGRLDGVVSTPDGQLSRCRNIDSKRFSAILLEDNVLELRRHLLTLTVQNQVLTQKLDQATKSKSSLIKKVEKSKEKIEDLCFQLEEKNIELAGTQAQLRILEARLNTNTPSSTHTSSYLQHSSSQHEYETNRSSTSTILTLSRRGNNADSTPFSGTTQISTPSMKAMVPLAMDDLQQQHSSSTESAQDTRQNSQSRLMDNSSPFDERQTAGRVQQTAKKFGGAAKPSKIPLPGSKSSTYFAGKPPSGRPLSGNVSRSPPSANTSTSNSSNRSSLSRSTGNLLYSKSPNSLKRNDSAQSIRSSNTSTTMQQQQQQQNYGATTPSTARILQNSPLPKQKRESLTSRLRHLDSLSRVHKSYEKEDKEIFSTPETELKSNLVSSTPKTAVNTRKSDWPMSASQNFTRRATTTTTTTTTTNSNASYAARRFSSASVMAGRMHGQEHHDGRDHKEQQQQLQQQASDSDSGKHSLMCHYVPFAWSPHNTHLGSSGQLDTSNVLTEDDEISFSQSNFAATNKLLVTLDYGYVDEQVWCKNTTNHLLDKTDFTVHHVQHADYLATDSLNSNISETYLTYNLADKCYSIDSLENKTQLVDHMNLTEQDESYFDSIEYM